MRLKSIVWGFLRPLHFLNETLFTYDRTVEPRYMAHMYVKVTKRA